MRCVLARRLERHVLRNGQFRRRFREAAVGQAALRGSMQDRVVFRAALRRVDAPFLRRCFEEHGARRRAGLAQRVPRCGSAGTASRALRAESWIEVNFVGGREFGADLLPVAIEFVRGDHREAGQDALAHLRLVDEDGYQVVCADVDPGIEHDGGIGRRSQRLDIAVKIKTDQQSGGSGGARFEEAATVHAWCVKTHALPPVARTSQAGEISQCGSPVRAV